ncbi:MAG: precorrin-3B C(17)-methyltransferase [Leptolyngbyaceae cyanobacterium]
MVAAITTTPAGAKSLISLCLPLAATLWLPEAILTTVELSDEVLVRGYQNSLKALIATLWAEEDSLVFALALGAVTRLIAPHLHDKETDPAVVVIDEAARVAISLCGGHRGGGDRLTHRISHLLGATPVITGAAHAHGFTGIDLLGQPFGWSKGPGDWTAVASAIAHAAPVQVIQEAGSSLWQQHLPAQHSFQFGWPEVPAPDSGPPPQARVWISPILSRFAPDTEFPKVQWFPRVLWIGLGCERNTDPALIATAIAQVLKARHLALAAVAGIGTIDIKADEPGILQICSDHDWPLRCFSADQLKVVKVPHPASVVEQAVGTHSVAEAAAVLAAMSALPLQIESIEPARTAETSLCVTKQVIREPGVKGAVTVAIAQANVEYTGRLGHLSLVGIGPGSLAQITPAAKDAIAQADAVIGYGLYIDLVRPLLRPGQIVESWSLTQEQQRAERAIALARWGLNVAVISSGDCGIYAMAGLVLETLQAQGWDGQRPTVDSYPGISAMQAAAARVGAPLMHDFCAISLSDLLTPWSVIETRLRAAAAADFVIALYNPRSKNRTEQIAIAQRIFIEYRAPETPVAIVRSAYRSTEKVVLTTIEKMLDHSIDMLTTVIIGNQSTQLYAGKLITPRGYRL